MTFAKSQALLERARGIPGRSNTRSKRPGALYSQEQGPLYVEYASGAVVHDVDCQAYIDMICALGAISLGHTIRDTLAPSLPTGVLSLPHRVEVEATEAILQHVAPWASQVRMLRTGSEATHAAYRIAKRATGRSHVLVGDWAYHGWHEWSDKHDPENSAFFYAHGSDLADSAWDPTRVAAVFVEPHRWEETDVNWLKAVRTWCDHHGALLVFDEMIYGGRWAIGGATEYFGVTPDLACFGKAFGNGAPVAFVVGNDALAQHGEMISGTYAGDVSALSMIVNVIDHYTSEPVVETLWKRGRQLRRGLLGAIDELGWYEQAHVDGAAPVHQRLRFDAPAMGKRFAGEMAARGVLWHPDVVNVCYAHSAEQIEHVIDAAYESLIAMKASQE